MAFKVNVGLVFCGVAHTVLICVTDRGGPSSAVGSQDMSANGRGYTDFCHPASSTRQAWVMVICEVSADLYIAIIPQTEHSVSAEELLRQKLRWLRSLRKIRSELSEVSAD
ncbi:hypothetical protein CDD80_2679 [Ophiocordyceps camponoti-rufipedis]|uniref:Secreted protein n=1 Tax=Ophiocordyceps camponoti-rufipedis TaxID=2004952 RepID=A0A2C5ZLF9_9HYPO|nr:hypothetical protein CDD80_2679 [Ophiocordyceps camponoti-rufipedis]